MGREVMEGADFPCHDGALGTLANGFLVLVTLFCANLSAAACTKCFDL